MEFNELLKQYMSTLSLTAKELSDLSGISVSVISRYRSGDRRPHVDSDTVHALARALASCALEKNIPDMAEEDVLSTLKEALLSSSKSYEQFLRNFNILYDELKLNMKDLSTFTNYEVSFLYRIKAGTRKPLEFSAFCEKVAQYLSSHYTSLENLESIARLSGASVNDLRDTQIYYHAVYQWLLSNHTKQAKAATPEQKPNHDVSQFLAKMDTFDLEDYIKVIHFDELKVPTVPFHLPSTKIYYGISKMREGELDFFKSTVTSKITAPVFMYSDMPILDMAENMDFNKKWMFAIACSIKKGLHLNVIHHLDRPFEELLLGLEAWIPLYMTGQVSPYYIPNASTPVYHHLNYVSGAAALFGESVAGAPTDGKYTLTNNKEELSYYQRKASHILSHAEPLMEIYDATRQDDYRSFLEKDASTGGERKSILSALPVYTFSEALLDKILSANQVSVSDASAIKAYHILETERMERKLKGGLFTNEIALPPKDTYSMQPMSLSLAGCFFTTPILYTYEDMLAHLQETKEYADAHSHYALKINDVSPFHNIQVEIVKNKYVIVSKQKSPSIHFVIRQPQLVEALQNFTVPVVE